MNDMVTAWYGMVRHGDGGRAPHTTNRLDLRRRSLWALPRRRPPTGRSTTRSRKATPRDGVVFDSRGAPAVTPPDSPNEASAGLAPVWQEVRDDVRNSKGKARANGAGGQGGASASAAEYVEMAELRGLGDLGAGVGVGPSREKVRGYYAVTLPLLCRYSAVTLPLHGRVTPLLLPCA
jgi:hypothetical protein